MISAIAALVSEIDHYLQCFEDAGTIQVRSGLARWTKASNGRVQPQSLPACAHLAEALASMKSRGLAKAIEAALPLLRWVTYDAYDRTEIGEAFSNGHAFASLIGEKAFYNSDDFDLGLFLIGPNVLYRDHHHAAPELYAPLTGPHAWRFLPETQFCSVDADVPVWNEPWAPHATLTGDVPFLSIFCWTSDVNRPAKVVKVDALQ